MFNAFHPETIEERLHQILGVSSREQVPILGITIPKEYFNRLATEIGLVTEDLMEYSLKFKGPYGYVEISAGEEING